MDSIRGDPLAAHCAVSVSYLDIAVVEDFNEFEIRFNPKGCILHPFCYSVSVIERATHLIYEELFNII